MGKLKESLIKRKNQVLLAFTVFLLMSPQLALEYSTDAYHIHYDGLDVYANMVMYRNGRPLSAIIIRLVNLIFGNFYALYYISLILCFFSIFFSILILQKEFSKFVPKLSYLLSVLTVLNPLSVEYFLFTEKGVFFLGILFGTLAFKFFIRFCQGKILYFPLASLFIALASTVYQPICAFFVPLAILYICFSEKTLKGTAVKTLWAILLYGLGLVPDVLFMSLFAKEERMSGIYFENLIKGFFPAGVWLSLLIYLAIFLILFGISALVTHKTDKVYLSQNTLVLFLKSSFILMSAICATIAPFLLTSPSEVWFPFRIIYPLGVGVVSVAVFFLSKGDFTLHVSVKSVVCVFIAFTFVFMEVMFVTRLINNYKDKELCVKIGEEIEKYEKESGFEIKNISIYYDKNVTHRNKGVIKIGDTNVRSFTKDWSDVDSINVYLNKDYKRTKQNKNIKEQFKDKDWQEYSNEQLIFVGDTLHLCVY